ncbi:helix-turn-helix transcriptional regulator [Streptococcus sp. H49]|uniref:XRE family transcriptional regulator n=1 Tax=Streptococcus chenjunshii TaxID=2173853 RepID=A0A372KMA7_9STRE|nr:helix-turn-helix transcriptional regulator [Streptococcus chenjunshii]AXQ77758.1 XRE family transcriptional regulator [Streptococcus chenjunshii]RFU50480.1 XRE family transcriptional regulator [Streptococcus chenjunshii]RFU52708.1 XRE family transcriptional regulator [Streptococcus chenjunshii]
MFPERLKVLRKEAGLTQKQIAEKLNMSQPAYLSWEKGKREPSAKTLEKFATFFNVSTDYLLGKTDDKRTPEKILEDDIDESLDRSVAYNGNPISDHDRAVIKEFLKNYFDNKPPKDKEK